MRMTTHGTTMNNFGKKMHTFDIGEEDGQGEEHHEDEDDDAEEAYATHMEVEEEKQPHSEDEDDDSYE